MQHRVRRIILVSSLYDSFILAQDGQLDELILTEFLNLDLRNTPDLTRVSTGAEALALLDDDSGRYDLIITSAYVGDMNAIELAQAVEAAGHDLPVIALAYDVRDVRDFQRRPDVSALDRIYLWQGDVRILLAIVNDVEDRLNVAHDTGEMGVQAIILIEDSVRFYSSFLPTIYVELMHHSHRLAPEGINRSRRLMRVQARPKVLLCTTFEEAWEYFTTYQREILGVISDIEFPAEGQLSPEAGVEFARKVREAQPDVSIMLQSSVAASEAMARSVGAEFLLKGSPTLLHQLQRFMVEHFGFGTFVFRTPDGVEVDRARDLKQLEAKLRTVPGESVAYHASRNHFSIWLKARTEFALAHKLRPRKVSDFATVEDLRQHLVKTTHEYRRSEKRVLVADFDRAAFDPLTSFYRLGRGSLGGKARGLAFVNQLLDDYRLRHRFPGVTVRVPRSVVLATDLFDRFVNQHRLLDFAMASGDDGEIVRRFLGSAFPDDVVADLAEILTQVRYPLAVRSSSLLEDSQYQPFSGIYDTYMIANNHADHGVRLSQLMEAIKRVYASAFSHHAKAYVQTTPYRLEEEKMAVILQRVVGRPHGDRFYPDMSGVARSHNFYPVAPMASKDGIAAVALGFGETVVGGEACVRFCPRYPRHLVQFASVQDAVRNSQRTFHAVDLAEGRTDGGGGTVMVEHGLELAEADGTLGLVGSTYSSDNDAVYDGISRPGVRLVSFAPVLKHGQFPLAEILAELLEVGEQSTSAPVEVEFAAGASGPDGAREFAFLQLRPLALSREMVELEIQDEEIREALCFSSSVLGNGKLEDLRDLIVVDMHRFDRGRSQDVAADVSRFNAALVSQGVSYGLIGVGRWGSRDPFLGIPVSWDQIAGARVIVEAGFRDFLVTPSQGTHFFQNLVTANVGYFTVNPEVGEGNVDWDWLALQPAAEETPFVRHLRFDRPFTVKMDGRTNRGVILRPDA